MPPTPVQTPVSSPPTVRRPRPLVQLGALIWKDLQTERRTREIVLTTAVFAALALLIFVFAFDLRVENRRAVAPGMLWVTVTFATLLALGRTYVSEKDQGTLEYLLTTPVDRSLLYLARLLATLVFLLVADVLTLGLAGLFFDLPLLTPGLLATVFLGTLGFASVGTLFAAMAANTRAREVLLPVLLLPVSVPVVIASVQATAADLGGAAGDHPWLGLLLAFDGLFLGLSALLFEHVLED